MSDMPFIKFFPSDFLGGTSGLSPAERGVYITILCLIWEGAGPVTMDEGRLARRCGMPKAAFKKSLASLLDEGKLFRVDGGLMNERAKKTLMDRLNRTQNATHAANSRWSAQEDKAEQKQQSDDAPAMQGQCVADAKPEARVQIEGGGHSACANEPISNPPDEGDLTERETLLRAMGADPISGMIGPNGVSLGRFTDMKVFEGWRADLGLSMPEILGVISEVMARKRDGPPSNFGYFSQPMQRFAGLKSRPALTPIDGGHQNERTHTTGPGGQQHRPISAAGQAHQSLISGFERAVSS